MKTVDQISRGVADFYDTEVRPSLSGWKAIVYGVVVGRAAANAPELIKEYETPLKALGILRDGMIDAEGLAAEMREQMNRSGGELTVHIGGDKLTFRQPDIDALMRCIERA